MQKLFIKSQVDVFKAGDKEIKVLKSAEMPMHQLLDGIPVQAMGMKVFCETRGEVEQLIKFLENTKMLFVK